MGKASPGEDGMVLRNPVDPASFMGSLVLTQFANPVAFGVQTWKNMKSHHEITCL